MARDFAKGFYNSKEWLTTRKLVLERDHYLCTICKEPANLVHHIIWLDPVNIDKDEIRLGLSNLCTVCHYCHNLIHLTDEVGTDNMISFDSNGEMITTDRKINHQILKQLQEQNYLISSNQENLEVVTSSKSSFQLG
ncbi:HNH endonuclease [Hutsoniella sourekii]|uniref:HNH endonuclease n=1 Tax=Hutsoniella sourekii TaxID=87650 RepID=UPI000685B93C|nr:HNH endonuclease [Hutsoniella sourekii]